MIIPSVFIFLSCHEKAYDNKEYSREIWKPDRDSEITIHWAEPCFIFFCDFVVSFIMSIILVYCNSLGSIVLLDLCHVSLSLYFLLDLVCIQMSFNRV